MTDLQQFARLLCVQNNIDPDEIVSLEDLTGANAGQHNENNLIPAWMKFFEEAQVATTDKTNTSKPDLTPEPLEIVVHTKSDCVWCDRAKLFLADHNLPFKIILHDDPKERLAFYDLTNTKSMPQIFLNGDRIGGYTQLISSGIASLA